MQFVQIWLANKAPGKSCKVKITLQLVMADNLFGHVACGTAAVAQRTDHLSALINVAAAAADTEPIVSATA